MKKAFVLLCLVVASLQAATRMGETAATMAPHTFKAIVAGGTTQGIIRVGPTNECVFPFANAAAWDPNLEELLFVGAPHHIPWYWGFPVYEAKANIWRSGPLEPFFRAGGSGSGICTHSYDKVTIRPQSGDMYWGLDGCNLFKYNTFDNEWVKVNSSNPPSAGMWSIKYFPDLDGLVGATDQGLFLYDIQANTWRGLGGISVAMHAEMAYDAVHHLMFVSGGWERTNFILLDSTGAVHRSGTSPWPIEVSECLLTSDPVTGDFLVMRADSLYAYNSTSNTWSGVVKNPLTSFTAHWAVVAPVSTYGIVAFMTNYQWPLLIYKHANR